MLELNLRNTSLWANSMLAHDHTFRKRSESVNYSIKPGAKELIAEHGNAIVTHFVQRMKFG